MPRKKKSVPLSERLRKRRDELNLSVDEVCKLAKVPNVTYMKIERAESENPQLKNITKIARVLNLSLDELVSDMYWEETDE
ncbi:MAG: helix-turn-helix domain-containing protein [Patescibacteria group bacterium]